MLSIRKFGNTMKTLLIRLHNIIIFKNINSYPTINVHKCQNDENTFAKPQIYIKETHAQGNKNC